MMTFHASKARFKRQLMKPHIFPSSEPTRAKSPGNRGNDR
jgi:hypothetical protein